MQKELKENEKAKNKIVCISNKINWNLRAIKMTTTTELEIKRFRLKKLTGSQTKLSGKTKLK